MLPAVLLAGAALAAEPTPEYTDQAACMQGPMAQFGRYIGDWNIEDERLSSDGSHWEPGAGARWIFRCVGGTAVQDYWMPNKGGFGTNLRIYNPDTPGWEIVWTATTLNGFTYSTAKEDENGDVVMDIPSTGSNPPARNTFHPPTEHGWLWVKEWSFDGGKTWTEVYRIKATPRGPDPT